MEKKTNWKKIIELVIVILTAIGSFIGGNVSAKNGFKIVNNPQKNVELCQTIRLN